jgi:membrane carboxypeptidase/penicillin-binding protein
MSAIPPIIKSRHRRKERFQKNFSKRLSRIALVVLVLISLIIASGIISVSILFAGQSKALPSLESLPLTLGLENNQLPQPSRLFDRSGIQVIAILENSAARGRDYLSVENSPESSLSASLISATIASAEPDYWTNPLFTLENIQDEVLPTIAQRIIRSNLLIDQPPSLQRLLFERILAAQVISRYGREKVLEWYLNSANYGNHAYGADAAARVYFGKSARNLSLAEAALLAAAAESPSLNPIDAPIAAHERKDLILNLMFEQGLITNDQLEAALDEEIKIQSSKAYTLDIAPDFTKLVIEQAGNFIRPEQLFRGGFDIITTLDFELQNQVECTIETQSTRMVAGTSETDLEECEMARLLPASKMDSSEENITFHSSVIVIDPNSGQVLSMSGEDGSGHPPGSILTPFIYLTSFTRGASPASMVWDIPANLVEGLTEVQNPDGEFHGPVSLRSAFANDYLIPAIHTLSQMNPDQVWHTARQMGINNLQVPEGDGGLLMPVEGGKADLLEISQAYGVFASQGNLAGISKDEDLPQDSIIPVTPQVVLKILDRIGNEQLDCTENITDCRSIKRPVITPQLAYLITDVLSDETARWPSLGHPNPLEIGRPTAAKIGYTSSREDAWTVGYTPGLVVSVWIGTEESGLEIRNSPDWAAGLWRAVIQYAMKDQPIEEFITPVGISEIQVCNPSGLLPTEECPHLVDEVFASGNEPTQTDNLFQTFLVNRESGRLATIFTSPVLIDEETYMIIPPEAEDWAREADIPKVPDAYDVVVSEQISSLNSSITSPNMFDTVKGSLPIIGRAAGADFEFYRLQYGSGLNPNSWLQIGKDVNEPVRNGQLGVWDTSDLSGLYALQLIVSYADGTVESATIQVTIDNQKPHVNIQYPGEDDIFSLSQEKEFTILVEANDDLEMSVVEIFIDGNLVASLKNPPYAFPWNMRIGEHILRVKAIDRAGNVSDDNIRVVVEE